MQTLASTSRIPAVRPTSLWTNMLNVFADPGEVFEEVLASPVNLSHWRAPTLLVCLTGILGLYFRMTGAGATGGGPLASSIVTIVAAGIGSVWSAFVLWFLGRVFLKARFSFWKTLEVAGLAGMILALGNVVTALLGVVSGNSAIRPSLGLLVGNLPVESATRQILETLNVFHLWSVAVLAIGLSKLGGVSGKEAAFWVFGYWVVMRVVVVMVG